MNVLNVAEMTRIAADAAHEQSEALEVIGVTLSGDYAEVLLSIHGCRLPPCQMSLGVFRNMPEPEIRAELAEKLRRHFDEHRPEGAVSP